MTGLPEHRYSPYDALPMSVVLSGLLQAIVRGHLGAIPEFFAQGRRAMDYQRELKHRKQLLVEASA